MRGGGEESQWGGWVWRCIQISKTWSIEYKSSQNDLWILRMDNRLFYLWCVKKEYNMGKEQIMEDAVRDLTELALQERQGDDRWGRTENVKTRRGSSTSYLSTSEDGMTVWESEDSSRGYYSGKAHMRNEKDWSWKSLEISLHGVSEWMLNQHHDDMYLHLVL